MPSDILLPLPVHPQPLSPKQLGAALDAAAVLEGHVTGIACAPALTLPVTFRPYPQPFLDEHAARQEAVKQAARGQLAAFDEAARRRGLAFEGRIAPLPGNDGSHAVVEFARLRNLTLLPRIGDDSFWSDLTEALIFESGRPVLVLPEEGTSLHLDTVTVAWDFSRAASRAIEDALPVLRKAGEVRVVIITDDKWLADNPSGTELARHLARNGVNIVLEETGLGFRTVGEAIEDAASGSGLLVMGAYGHSRIRDFFLGGATRYILQKPKLPVLLSH